ncbi:hypothetical protein ACOME3_004946 [Neoechinorhynchus agilis]
MADLNVRDRLNFELKFISEQTKFTAVPDTDDLMIWLVYIKGPNGSPYIGGTFVVQVHFPEEYPFLAPTIRFLTPIYHPNVDMNGELCTNIFSQWWSYRCDSVTLIQFIQELLRQPDLKYSMNDEITDEYLRDRLEFERKAQNLTSIAIVHPEQELLITKTSWI